MALSQQVEADLKAALKARDAAATSCLRLIRAALQSKAKELGRGLTDQEELAVLNSLAKQRRESVEQFRRGGREDLARAEEAELAVIARHLPDQVDQAGVERVLDQVFAELNPRGPQDMGPVMKESMARLAGRADGKLVSRLVRERLAG
jgi:hypothetical protein